MKTLNYIQGLFIKWLGISVLGTVVIIVLLVQLDMVDNPLSLNYTNSQDIIESKYHGSFNYNDLSEDDNLLENNIPSKVIKEYVNNKKQWQKMYHNGGDKYGYEMKSIENRNIKIRNIYPNIKKIYWKKYNNKR